MRPEHPIVKKHTARLEQLNAMCRTSVKHLFRLAAPPDLQALDGEYYCELLAQGGRIENWLIHKIVKSALGNWKGKAFRFLDEQRGGVGYNWFMEEHGIDRKLPMRVYIGPGAIAKDGLSMIVDYSQHKRWLYRMMSDEIRQLEDGFMLGFGCFGPRLGRGTTLQRTIPFAMLGPLRNWVEAFPRSVSTNRERARKPENAWGYVRVKT